MDIIYVNVVHFCEFFELSIIYTICVDTRGIFPFVWYHNITQAAIVYLYRSAFVRITSHIRVEQRRGKQPQTSNANALIFYPVRPRADNN